MINIALGLFRLKLNCFDVLLMNQINFLEFVYFCFNLILIILMKKNHS